jgi:hypothetical protein
MKFKTTVCAKYNVVTADYISEIPKLPYKPATPETWQAIRHAQLDKKFGEPSKDKWQEAELPIGQLERDMLKAADTDMIERFGYISHLIDTHYPKQYANFVDYGSGKVIVVKAVQ